MAEWGHPPMIVGQKKITDTERYWYYDNIDFDKFRGLIKTLPTPAKVWIIDDTALVSNSQLSPNVSEIWEFTDENFESGFHGHHVGGIIAATVFGMNPKIKIAYGKALAALSGSGSIEWIANSITKANELGYSVINASLGSDYPDTKIKGALKTYLSSNQNFFVAAAGNDSKDTDYPAAWAKEFKGLIAVGAYEKIGNNIKVAMYSSSGTVTIVFPGTNILSTFPDEEYAEITGTSMATPFCSALIATAKAIKPTFSHDDFHAIINKIGVSIEKGNLKDGAGMISPLKFIEEVKKLKTSPPSKEKRKFSIIGFINQIFS